MRLKKLSRTFAENLLRLLEGETVNASAFGSRRLLARLEEDRAVSRFATGRNRAVYRCNDPDALRIYLRLHFGISDLDAYIELLDQHDLDGEGSLSATTSTKALRQKSMQGFFIKSFDAEIRLKSHALPLLPEGAELFISDFQTLEISRDVLIIGVENPECFQKAGRLLEWFPRQPLVFVLKFYSNRLLDWLTSIQNPYLHFGDFDPAGIAIYSNEYLPRLGNARCRFFVPDGIEGLIANGDPVLFDRQTHLWPPKAEIQQPELNRLVEMINRFGKGLEQEFLLKESDDG